MHFLMSLVVSEPANKGVSAAERAREASRAQQANKLAVRVNERTDEQLAQYFSLYSWLFCTIACLGVLYF